ncbi:hypothetical protein ACFLQL_00545 [Verrucomicrobiota bacterium]
MKIKYFNKAFKDKTNKQLIDEIRGLNQAIDVIGCYGVRDLTLREAIDSELAQRGYESVAHTEYYKKDEMV